MRAPLIKDKSMNKQLNPVAMPGTSQFRAIADFTLDQSVEIPEVELLHASTLLVDTLGVAAGAAVLAAGSIARDFAADFYPAGSDFNSARMLFDGRKVSLPGAAWALATQIDNLDGHDGFNPVKGHIGCAVVPSLFAFGERHPDISALEALRTLAISYEIAARAGMSLHATVSDYHTSGAWNALGVAAMGCRLEGADDARLRHAIGIAEYHGPRSQMMREIDNPTMLHDGSGMGAFIGCTSALLAMRGFTGAPAITAEAAEVADFWEDLGRRWTVSENYIKPYPSCRWGHAAIDALRKLMSQGVTAENVEHVEVRTFDEAARLFAGVPETTTQAQYSLNFVMAVMLKHGFIGPSHVAGEGLEDPDVMKLIPKISAVSSERHNARFPEGRWSDVEVCLKDGRRLSSGDVDASGGPGAWRPDSDVEEKFHVFCDGVLSESRIKAIWAMRDKMLDPATRLKELASLASQPADIPAASR